MTDEQETSVLINGETFMIEDCGGDGACLFKCIAMVLSIIRSVALQDTDHIKVREEIVDYVIKQWKVYRVFASSILFTKTRPSYRRLMSSITTYGSEIEVRAAAELYGLNITVFREYEVETEGIKFFTFTFGCQDNGRQQTPVILYFTGMTQEDDDDGHYQLLKKVQLEMKNVDCKEIESKSKKKSTPAKRKKNTRNTTKRRRRKKASY